MSTTEKLIPIPAEGGARDFWEKRLALEEDMKLEDGTEDTPEHWRRALTINLVTAAVKLCGLWERGRRNASSPRFREEALTCPGLPPALDGLRVLHLSDFHLRAADQAYTDHIAEMVRGVKADFCFMTGDYSFGHFGSTGHVEAGIKHILQGVEASRGVFGILGNHDKSGAASLVARAGAHMLINEGLAVEVRGHRVWIGGVDDPHHFRCASVTDAMKGSATCDYRVLLAHSAEVIDEAVEKGAQLYLCGHSHGGQICLPGGFAPLTHTRADRAYASGKWRVGDMAGYTTRGLGVSDVPVRFQCLGEAVCFTLRAA